MSRAGCNYPVSMPCRHCNEKSFHISGSWFPGRRAVYGLDRGSVFKGGGRKSYMASRFMVQSCAVYPFCRFALTPKLLQVNRLAKPIESKSCLPYSCSISALAKTCRQVWWHLEHPSRRGEAGPGRLGSSKNMMYYSKLGSRFRV